MPDDDSTCEPDCQRDHPDTPYFVAVCQADCPECRAEAGTWCGYEAESGSWRSFFGDRGPVAMHVHEARYEAAGVEPEEEEELILDA